MKLIEQFEFGLFFWQILIFVGLFFLLRKFAWGPILKAVSDREDGIRSALQSAEVARQELVNLQAKNEQALQDARAERDAMLKEAREIKERMIADAKSEAAVAGEAMISQAKATIEAEKNAAVSELKQHISGLSVDIAEKILKKELSDKTSQVELVENLLVDTKLN